MQQKMIQKLNHFKIVFDFFTVPIKLAFRTFFKPHKLHEIMHGTKGIEYSIIINLWYAFYTAQAFGWSFRSESYYERIKDALATPFALELLATPLFLTLLTVVWLPARILIQNAEDRTALISLTIIVLTLCTVPYIVLANLSLLPVSWIVGTAGYFKVDEVSHWAYIAMTWPLAILWIGINLRPLLNSTSRPRGWTFVAVVLVLLITVSWWIESAILNFWLYALVAFNGAEDIYMFFLLITQY